MEPTRTSAQKVRLADYNGTSLAAKQISLTFDDGPGSRTLELSAFLKGKGIKATFFSNGHCFGAGNPCGNPVGNTAAVVFTQLVADGHLVANHTEDHKDLTNEFPNTPAGSAAILAQVVDTDAIIAPYVPNNHFLLRPPYGAWDSRPYDVVHPTAMDKYVGPIRWDIGGQMTDAAAGNYGADWDCWQNTNTHQPLPLGVQTSAQCGARYMNEIHDVGKGIALMHDSSTSSPGINNHDVNAGTGNTIDMVKFVLVPQLMAEGYTFVRTDDVPDINAALPPPPCDASCTTCSGPAANQCSGCADGKYLSGGSCVACSAACSTCSGAGAAACTSCMGGKYLAGGACNPCSACGAAQYQAAACTGTSNTICTACDASCASCSGAGTAACTSCKPSTWLNGSNCSACTVCGPATYPATACTSNANAVCAACDASCGNACSGPNPDQCGTCPLNMYLSAGSCHACAACAAGTARTAACTPTANAVCTACAPGKFSASAGATSCTACAPGTHAAAGAAACSACEDCNDNDVCTTDSCEGAKGCTHATIPGCTKSGSGTTDPPAPTPAADAGEPGGGGDGGGCSVGHGSPRSGLFLLALNTLALLLWRRRSGQAHS